MIGELIVITGARGTGKTFLAGTYASPKDVGRVYWQDSEHSATRLLSELERAKLKLGRYVSLGDRFQDMPGEDDLLSLINKGKLPWVTTEEKRSLVEYYRFVLDDIAKNLTAGKFDVFVHDTLERLEAGMAAWVEDNKKTAGVTRLAYGGLWTDGIYPLYEQLLSAVFARGVKTVILTSHLKTPWEGSQRVVGKVVPSGKRLLYFQSSLMLWLVNEPRNADGAPAGIVLKERMGELAPTESGEWRIKRKLPRRVPHCTWMDIRNYLDRGCNLASPAEGESLSDGEQAMISELLTDEQMRLMILSAERDLEEIKAASTPVIEVSDKPLVTKNEQDVEAERKAHELSETGASVEEIAAEIGKPVPLVRQILAAGG